MGLDLTNQYVDETYQKLIQLSGSNQITDGTGSLVTDLDINVSTAVSSSFATTASYAENANVDSGSWDGQYTGSATILGALEVNGSEGILNRTLVVRGNENSTAVFQATATGSGFRGLFQGAHLENGIPTATLGFQFDATDLNAVKPQIYFDDNLNGADITSEGDLNISSLSGVARLNGTASYADLAGNVTGTVTNALYAQNTITTGKNISGGDIPKGTPLYFTGSGTGGNLVGILIADAGNPDRMPAGGVAGETIVDEAEGVVLLDGYIGGVDTSLFQPGDEVFVGVGGGYTNVAPTGSNNLIQHLGNVEKSHPNNGSGVIQMMGEPRGLPNIQQGYAWVGDANDVPQAIPTSSFGGGEGFPFTGSADISGSLNVVGPITANNFGTISLTGDSPGINRNIIDSTGADFTVIRSDSNIEIDNRAGSGSVSVFTNGNMQFEPQGDLDFYTPTGRINLTAASANLTVNDGPISLNLKDGDNTSNVAYRKGQSSYNFNIFQSPGFTGSFLSVNGVDEFKLTGDVPLALDNTGYGGTNDVSLRASDDVRLAAQNDIIQEAQDVVQITSNTTQDFQGINLTAPNVRVNLSRTGSGAGDFALSAPGFGQDTPGMLLSLGTGSYGSNPTTANMLFTGDDAFFSAVGNFYIKNVFNDTGSITVWSESELELRGDTRVKITGDNFSNPNDPIPIDINGSAFLDGYSAGIMGFFPQIGTYTRVGQFQRAFVETPLVINAQGTVEVQTGATLKIINEL